MRNFIFSILVQFSTSTCPWVNFIMKFSEILFCFRFFLTGMKYRFCDKKFRTISYLCRLEISILKIILQRLHPCSSVCRAVRPWWGKVFGLVWEWCVLCLRVYHCYLHVQLLLPMLRWLPLRLSRLLLKTMHMPRYWEWSELCCMRELSGGSLYWMHRHLHAWWFWVFVRLQSRLRREPERLPV